MACGLPAKEEYYDLQELKRQNHRLDRLVDFVAVQNRYRLQNYKVPSKILLGFNMVTRDLVRQFKAEAISFMQQVLANKTEYGYLFNVLEEEDPASHVVYIRYDHFPLMELGVKSEIEFIANKLPIQKVEELDVACLYLLIFYALLVNRHVNWVTIEYVTNCNIEHAYAIHINWYQRRDKRRGVCKTK